MKKVFCFFDYLFVSFKLNIIVDNSIISDKSDDMIFIVHDEDTTDETFHKLYETFLTMNDADPTRCDEWKECQREFYVTEDQMNERYNEVVDNLKTELMEVTSKRYTIVKL